MSRPKSKQYLISQFLREKIIKEVEKKYCKSINIDYTDLQRFKGKTSESSFRVKELGEDWKRITGLGEEYLRQNLYDDKYNTTDGFLIIENLYNGLKKYLERDVFDEIFKNTNLAPPKPKDKNKQYYIFYYYDEKLRNVGVAKGLMIFDNQKHEVLIKDRAHTSNMELNYYGDCQLILNDEMLLMTLKIKHSHQRDLHVILHIGNYGNLPKMLLGQYHNIDHKNTIVSGSLICIKQDSHVDYDSFKPLFYRKGTKKYLDEVALPVRSYLSQKLNNRIKVPKGIFSFEDLLNQKEQKRKTYNSSKEIKKVFLSTPSTSLKNETEYVEIRKEMLKLKSLLSNQLHFDCYCALESYENLQDFTENNILFNEIERQLDSCDLFIMIITQAIQRRVSSSFIEFGYALNRDVFCTIFVQKDIDLQELLPNLMEGAIANKKNYINKYRFQNLEEIHDKVRKNGLLLFGNKIL